ncbi:response regulator [Cryobacterium frigoriphilum]|uniref:Response regulator n=1 Tax=Cryobacterium frigoriphilum TaxID=1259150 RepID=A0A4R9AAN3_9MICO|nr:response regulator [Cryobacterium frigoriphilum]TFD55293.1 response regulator [Cryobacterium frigoriphilum]
MARVLVIEDNGTNMKLATLLLTRAGHTVLAAADAETGLTLAHSEKPELILMDIQLPGMDGLAATALLKQDPATAGIPVIALTAMAMKADQDRSRLAGCDGYITKPLRYQELYAAIDALLVNREVEAAGHLPEPHHVPSLFVREEATFEPPARDEAILKGRLILVVEDNETNQKVLVRQLALLGWAADVVDTGVLALERWRSGDYALVISDLRMPGLDGFRLAAAIRADEQTRGEPRATQVPIIALTANSQQGEEARCIAAGMDGYLTKPLQLATLKLMLARWLPHGAPTALPATVPAFLPDVSVARSAAAPAVDVSMLESLVGNDPAVILDFLTDFRASALLIGTALVAACQADDTVGVGAQAHKLKSSSRSVGAAALGDLCDRLEVAGKAGRLDTLALLRPVFEQELRAVLAFLDACTAAAPAAVPTVTS